jgi:hypothetical protein
MRERDGSRRKEPIRQDGVGEPQDLGLAHLPRCAVKLRMVDEKIRMIREFLHAILVGSFKLHGFSSLDMSTYLDESLTGD